MSPADRPSDLATSGDAVESAPPPSSLLRSPRPPREIVRIERLHARDRSGPRARSRGLIHGLDLVLDAGVHAFLGAPEDGTIALSETLSGAEAPLKGTVLVEGRSPSSSARVRARIGSLSATPRLPPASSVDAVVRMAMRARGETGDGFDAVLDPLGLSALHGRSPRSLSYAEARAVELALALTTPAPLLLVLHEPLLDVATAEAGVVRERLRAMVQAGACVAITTSSVADARGLADRIHVLQRGRVVRSVAGEGSSLTRSPGDLLVWVRLGKPGVRELAAAVALREGVHAVAWEEPGPGSLGASLRVRGDLDACALAIADAAAETHAVVEALTTVAPGLAEVRAATERFLKAAATSTDPPSNEVSS